MKCDYFFIDKETNESNYKERSIIFKVQTRFQIDKISFMEIFRYFLGNYTGQECVFRLARKYRMTVK